MTLIGAVLCVVCVGITPSLIAHPARLLVTQVYLAASAIVLATASIATVIN